MKMTNPVFDATDVTREHADCFTTMARDTICAAVAEIKRIVEGQA